MQPIDGQQSDMDHAPTLPAAEDARGVEATRRLFWHNVVREMLVGLSILRQNKPELFDGRFAVLTRGGERIPIGQVYPLFACSVPGTQWEKELSIAVQCTVFRIATPDGEVYTVPVHEVRAMHALTPELIEQLQKAAEAETEDADDGKPAAPFGLAAFAAMPKPMLGPAPEHPTE